MSKKNLLKSVAWCFLSERLTIESEELGVTELHGMESQDWSFAFDNKRVEEEDGTYSETEATITLKFRSRTKLEES